MGSIDPMQAHREGYSPRCYGTIRPARSRAAGYTGSTSWCSWLDLRSVWSLINPRGGSVENPPLVRVSSSTISAHRRTTQTTMIGSQDVDMPLPLVSAPTIVWLEQEPVRMGNVGGLWDASDA